MSTFLGWAVDDVRRRSDGRLVSPLVEPRYFNRGEKLAVVSRFEDLPHELDVGATGGGKSTLLRAGAIDLSRQAFEEEQHLRTEDLDEAERERRQTKMIICDGKGGNSFTFLEGQPGIVALPNDPDAITEAILTVREETARRYEEYDRARVQARETRRPPDYTSPGWLHLWIDEYMTYILQLPGGREPGGREEVLNALIAGGQVAREVKVRFRIATQRPDARSVDVGLPGIFKAQLKVRVAMSGPMGLDGIESWMVFDERDYGRKVRTGVGSGFVKVGGFEHAFQVPWVPDPTDPDPAITQEERDHVWAMLPYDPRRRAAA